MTEQITDNPFGLYWVADSSDTLISGKFARRALDVLTDKAELYESMTKSRVAGAAIQFYRPPAYLKRREIEFEEELESEGVSVRESGLFSVADEKNYFKQSNADLVSKVEYEDIDNNRTKLSLPETVIEEGDKACEESESYNLREKARFVSNAVLAFEASAFGSLLERIETKEQLLKTVRGENVDNPTPVFELIENGEVFEGVQVDVFECKEVIDSLEDIDPEDDVVLESDHPVHENTWGDDGLGLKKTNGRAGVAMAYFRSLVEEFDSDGFDKEFYTHHISVRMPDYNDAEYVFDEYLKEHLEQGADGKWYVYESESEGDVRDAKIEDISTLASAGKQKKALGRIVEDVAGVSGVKSASQIPDSVGVDELDEIAQKLVTGLPKGSYRQRVLEDVSTVQR